MNLIEEENRVTIRDPDYRIILIRLLSLLTDSSERTIEIALKLYKDFTADSRMMNYPDAYIVNGKFTLPKKSSKEALKILLRLKLIKKKYDEDGNFHYGFNATSSEELKKNSDEAMKKIEDAMTTLKGSIEKIFQNPDTWDEIKIDQSKLNKRREEANIARDGRERKRKQYNPN